MLVARDQRLEAVPKHELVFHAVASAIRSRELAPGDRLPDEAELARRHGVSRNSVRRALLRLRKEGAIETRRGSGSYVASRSGSRATADRDMAVVVRYVPGSTASLIGHATGPWWSLLRDGLMCGAAQHGLQLVDEPCAFRAGRGASAVPAERLAGFLVVAFGQDNPAALIADLPPGAPRLLVNRPSADPAVSSLTIDRELGAYRATSFLLKLGHRRIGIDVRDDDDPPSRDRLRGYLRAFEAASLPVDDAMIFEGVSGPSYLEWPKRLHEFLQGLHRPTALLIHHANRVLHIMEVLQSRGIQVPQDLSLIVIDDDPALAQMTPPLSAIRDPYFEMGRRAITMLLTAGKAGHENQHLALEPELVMRESVLPLDPEDRDRRVAVG